MWKVKWLHKSSPINEWCMWHINRPWNNSTLIIKRTNSIPQYKLTLSGYTIWNIDQMLRKSSKGWVLWNTNSYLTKNFMMAVVTNEWCSTCSYYSIYVQQLNIICYIRCVFYRRLQISWLQLRRYNCNRFYLNNCLLYEVQESCLTWEIIKWLLCQYTCCTRYFIHVSYNASLTDLIVQVNVKIIVIY